MVVVNHALAVVVCADVAQALLDALHPFGGDVFVARFVIHGHDFVFEQGVNGGGVGFVAVRRIGLAVADGPAAGVLGGFVEPAIEDAQAEHAVDAGFHAAGAAGFFAAARGVQPEIHALHHFAGDFDAVVFDEDHVAGKFRIARKLHNFADQCFTGNVFGMGFAGDDDLHGHGWRW